MSRPRRVTAALLSLVAATSVLAAAPVATAAVPTVVPSTDQRTDQRTDSSWGTAVAERQTLRKGCRSYAFRYRIDVPGDAWMAEIVLDSPAGRGLASLTYKSDLQPDAGTGHFRFCDVSTRPGRHTIRLKVTSYDFRDQASRRSAPTTFRIVRR